MMIGDDGFKPALVVGAGEAAGVRQLQTDQQILRAAEALAMLGDKRFAQLSEIGERIVIEQELMGIGSAVVADGDGFAAPNELGPAGAETLPASARQLTGPTVAHAVPALHRQDGEAIADG